MPPIFTVNYIGKELWYWPFGAPAPLQVLLPAGVTPTGRPASIVSDNRRSYILGAFSSPICLDETGRATTMGLLAPAEAPGLVGSSVGNVDGACVAQYAYRYKNGSRIICESNLSQPIAVTFANEMASWSGLLPSPDPKANFLVTYRAMDGALPRESAERPIGTSSFIENRAELALGAVPPVTPAGDDIANNRGVPPWGMFAESFHRRLWIGGDPRYPDRVWYSEVNEYEAFGARSYIETLEHEPVTGIKKVGSVLIVTCRRCCYIIRGYTNADFTIYKLDPLVGCVSHFSIVSIYNILVWASEEGMVACDGGKPKYIMEDLRQYWREEFEADPTPFQNSLGAWDPKEEVYKLLTPRLTDGTDPDSPVSDTNPPVSPRSVYYCCDMGDEGLYHWFLDKRDRIDSTMGVMSDGRLVTGSSDGFVRLENQYADADDDGDTYLKKLKIRTGLYLFNDPGGSSQDGKKFGPCWIYMTSETTAWTLHFLAGDEEAWSQLPPDDVLAFKKFAVAASALTQTVTIGATSYTQVAIPKSVHNFEFELDGRGLCIYVEASSPLDMRWLGAGGQYQPGVAPRPAKSMTIIP